MAVGCNAKCVRVRGHRGNDCIKEKMILSAPDPKRNIDDPENPCCFMSRDGNPCRRKAVKDGACRIHLRDAEVMKRMVEQVCSDEFDKSTQTDAVVDDDLRSEVEKLRTALSRAETAAKNAERSNDYLMAEIERVSQLQKTDKEKYETMLSQRNSRLVDLAERINDMLL